MNVMFARKVSHTNGLVRYQRTHTGDKPYECDVCKKRYPTKSNLTKHKRTQTKLEHDTKPEVFRNDLNGVFSRMKKLKTLVRDREFCVFGPTRMSAQIFIASNCA